MSDSSDDDVPLAARIKAAPAAAAPTNGTTSKPKSTPKAKPTPKPAARPRAGAKRPASDDGDDDDDEQSSGSGDDVPIAQKAAKKKAATPASGRKKASGSSGSTSRPAKHARASSADDAAAKKGNKMWSTLSHCGVVFPPEYEPHGVKMLYDGKPVDLTEEQEEVASMFASMMTSDYKDKPTFMNNFWAGFKEVLGPKHIIKDLAKCDFTPMHTYFEAEREKKREKAKALTKEAREALKKEKDEAEAKYKIAVVDGKIEQVGNFRVEPPSLFRGRGEHPKMGRIKKRVYPRDVTINIGKGEPIPMHPYPGQDWKEVRHDQTVTWLAFWKDTVNQSEYKYVFLAATSGFKADSDLLKYEKARKLKGLIGEIRTNYESDWTSKDQVKRQMAVALYFLDKLALRAGHEKDEDEADTVGCCTLKCENVEMVSPNKIKFDFLGKDSIKYENTVEVHEKVYAAVEKFKKMDQHGKKKEGRDMLFDAFDATALNKLLKAIMDGLSVKVFRTYNASIVLDRLLREQDAVRGSGPCSVDERKADYDRANKEVAILCNHQKSIGKAHDEQVGKIEAKLAEMNAELVELEEDLKLAQKGKTKKVTLEDGGTKDVSLNEDAVRNRIARKKEQIAKKQLQAAVKEDLKTVALGTSKINYMDPRITIAWCKRNDVPIEKIFNKSLLGKFGWCMETEPEFEF
ncbi:hypothetical protein FOA52_014610 [Chlamydomonas sp. UWO 241]|nr:hypothetical protein FOA52_014610 [Chlamydomonas sp. UWO 241]